MNDNDSVDTILGSLEGGDAEGSEQANAEVTSLPTKKGKLTMADKIAKAAIALPPITPRETPPKQPVYSVGRPSTQDYFRVCPDPAYTAAFLVLEYPKKSTSFKDKKTYLVLNESLHRPGKGFSVRDFYLCQCNSGRDFLLWGVGRSNDSGWENAWLVTAREIVLVATKSWVCLRPVDQDTGYRYDVSTKITREPEWPTLPFSDLVAKAFGSRVIEDDSHDVIRKLDGAE
jgi:hypothetical protein